MNQEGIIKKVGNFVKKHFSEVVLGTVGLISGICMINSTKRNNERQDYVAGMMAEEHERKMKLYEKAKDSKETNVNINL